MTEFEAIVARAAATVAADWAATGAPLGEIEVRAVSVVDAAAARDRFVTIEMTFPGTDIGPVRRGYLWGEDPVTETILAILDELQTYVSESSDNWGNAWPRCPLHPAEQSPLLLRVPENVPTWVCTRTGATVSPVGHLQAP